MKQQTALFVGDVTFDLTMMVSQMPGPDEKVDATSAFESPGGVATNAAMACAISGTDTQLVIAVGGDQQGASIAQELGDLGITTSISCQAGLTSRVVTIIEPHGEKRLFLYPGVSMYPTKAQAENIDLNQIGWVHSAVYNLATAELLFSACREANTPWSLDLEPSTFPSGIEDLRHCISGAETVFCNERSISMIGSSAVELLIDMGAKSVILTQGADGAMLCHKNRRIPVTAPPIQTRDTTGAGDCLAGWFVSEQLSGQSPEASLNTAVHAASISCSLAGTKLSFPSREEVQKFQSSKTLELK